jgi:isoquinoline 1-oxidoreductase
MTEKLSTRNIAAEASKPSTATGEELTISRRTFVQTLGAGLLITVTDTLSWGQRRGGRGGGGGGSTPVVARLHLNEDGTISVMSGKVEEGQGARTELSQAAAEELRVPFERIRIVMADTDFVPDDGGTSGSRTTPYNVPPMRQAAATARELLTRFAAQQWQVEAGTL